MKMKKLIYLIALITMTVVLVACGGSKKSKNNKISNIIIEPIILNIR